MIVGLELRLPHGYAQGKLFRARFVEIADVFVDLIHRPHQTFVIHAGQQDDEFIARVSNGHAFVGNGFEKDVAHDADGAIASTVAELIVDSLEIVHIHHNAVGGCSAHDVFLGEDAVQIPSVVKP